MNLSLILCLIGILSFILKGNKSMNPSNKFSDLFSSLLVLAVLTLLLILAILFDEFLNILNTALAESDDESNSDKKEKRDKGKGKATESEIQALNPFHYSSSDEETKDDAYLEARKQQEEYDHKFAQMLQNEEYNDKYESEADSLSNYTVYSSDIHSDDSENTVSKKLGEVEDVKEENNKRKAETGSEDEKPQRKSRKVLPKK